jgi:uncharacterized protein (DUF342 family)
MVDGTHQRPGGTTPSDLGSPQRDLLALEQFLEEVADHARAGRATSPPARDAAEYTAERAWVAAGMGCATGDLSPVVAGAEAGRDAGRRFFGLPFAGGQLLVRDDGLQACVQGVSLERLRDAATRRALLELRFDAVEVEAPPPDSVTGAWVRVARGIAPQPGRADAIRFHYPGRPGQELTYEVLALLSAELHQFYQESRPDPQAPPDLRGLAVLTGEVLARVAGHQAGRPGRDVFGRVLAAPMAVPGGNVEAGSGVSLSPAGDYRAERSGYLCLAQGLLSILSPVWSDADDMHAYWLLIDERAYPLTEAMVHQCLADAGITAGVRQEAVTQMVAQVQAGTHAAGLALLAEGVVPVNGDDAQVDMVVDLQRRAGREAADGSIDFREVNYTPTVRAGQPIARRRPAQGGAPGHDIKGRVLGARPGQELALRAGQHVDVVVEDGVEVFVANSEGVVRRQGDELRIVRQLVVKGDVDFATGNLDFRGEIHVGGSVVQGFSVKATETVTIAHTVENGSTVISAADVVVGHGIIGRRTRLTATGHVRAQFIHEARVDAGGDIVVGNYAYHALLRADGKVVVHKGVGSRGGSVLGGTVWGQDGVEAYQLGSSNGIGGTVVAGLQPGEAQQLDRIKNTANTCQDHLHKVLRRFGLARIDVDQIRNQVAAATGPQRRVLVHNAHQLGQLVQLYQKLQAEQAVIEGRIRTAAKGASITVRGTAYWGVTVRVGEYRRKLTADVESPRFHVYAGQMVER